MAILKKDGYKIPQKPDEKEEEKPELKIETSKKKLSSPSVRIMDPKDIIVRDDLRNPHW